MARPTPQSFFHDLRMPLRDALRGVATLADATEEMLEPTAQLLPSGLRARFREALGSIEQVGKRLIYFPIEMDTIATASRFLLASESGTSAADKCATVFAHAWEHLNEARVTHRYMISETILAERMRRTRSASSGTGFVFAATVLIDARRSSAIGLLPRLARSFTAEEQAEIDLTLLTIGVWLLSNRAETMANEEKLLELAMALVHALQAEAATVFSDVNSLPRFLADVSAHL